MKKYHHVFFAFTTQLSFVEISKNVQDALQVPEWNEVVPKEMRALQNNMTWEIVDLPKGKKTIGYKWVFIMKYKLDRSLKKYKARLMVKGFT